MPRLRSNYKLAAMIAVALSTTLTIAIVVCAWFLDQRALGCNTPVRAILGLIPLAIGAWICLTIIFALAFKVPGAYGPVQYWVGDMQAHRFMRGPRTVALFAIWGGLIFAGLSVLATIVSLALKPHEGQFKRVTVPTAALAIYGLSWVLFIHYGFYPSA